jgi:hypothetical protein
VSDSYFKEVKNLFYKTLDINFNSCYSYKHKVNKKHKETKVMTLAELVQNAIAQAESELKDHKKLRTKLADILKWMQSRKVGFLVHKPSTVSEDYLPAELIEYLESDYCTGNEILIPYTWEVDCDHWKSTRENRNFWHICKTSFTKQKPMSKTTLSNGLGSPNTWERGKD